MAERISRAKLARYVAQGLMSGKKDVVRELAAYLVEAKRTKEADLVIRAIYDELEAAGVVVADVVTAHPIDKSVREHIKQLTGAKQLELREKEAPEVLGGIRISTASRVLDATLQNRLMKLRERKV